MAQVTQYPYLCSFETGPDNESIVGNEPHWYGNNQWYFDDAVSNSGTFCARSSISTDTDYGRLIYVSFTCTNQSNIQPSLYYRIFTQNVLIRIVGRVNYDDWVVLKDWFLPEINDWALVDHSQMNNLSIFDNQTLCYFGITAKKSGSSSGTLRIDDVQLLSGGSGGTTCTWLGSATNSNWHDAANWDVAAVPGPGDDVVIPYVAANFPEVGTANAVSNDMNILPGGRLGVSSGFQLDVGGDLTIESDAAADGSLLNKGTLNISGNAVYQRYIDAYTTSANGWHLLSSPVNSFIVAGSDFEPGSNDDLYQWDEPSWQWLNYKTDPFNFTNGKAYLIAYENSGIRSFTGNFNNSDINMLDLSFGTGNGWHLLGNPFPCAVKWNDGNWNLSNIEGIAKIYDETAGNYIDLTANSIIPATQGFFVKAGSAVNSITIPAASRVHDATAFYKDGNDVPVVQLKVQSAETGFYDINRICFLPDATAAYDMMYDGHKMFGQEEAPQLYMRCESGEYLSTNALPTGSFTETGIYFEAGTEGVYVLTIEELKNIENHTAIFLEDSFNDSLIHLKKESRYEFDASPSYPALRFKIRIEDASAGEEINFNREKVYSANGNIYIRNAYQPARVEIYDITGKLVHAERRTENTYCIRKEMKNGIYLIRINNKVYKLLISDGL